MSLPIRFEWDADGDPRAYWSGQDPAGAVLAQFLETDLGFHQAFVARILDEGRRLLAVDHGDYRASGNAFSLTMLPHETVIAPLHDDTAAGTLTVRTEDFVEAVARWRAFLDDLDDSG